MISFNLLEEITKNYINLIMVIMIFIIIYSSYKLYLRLSSGGNNHRYNGLHNKGIGIPRWLRKDDKKI